MKIDEKIMDMIRDKSTQLPTLPIIVEKILTIAREERTTARDLADFVSKDQAITNKILRLANSAYYGMMKEIDSISRAITIIGFNEVVSLTIGMGVMSSFQQKGLNDVLDMQGLWLHSIACAFAAKKIAKNCRLNIADQVFLNGLLHDTGKVILAIYFPNEYQDVLGEARNSQVELYKTEKRILNIDHAILSGYLMERWHFPDNLVLPSRFHHNPDMCPKEYQQVLWIVKFGDYLCQQGGIGYGGNPVVPALGKIRDYFGLSDVEVDAYVEELKSERPQIEAFFEIAN